MSNPGDLDTTFGTGGKVTTDFYGSTDEGYSVTVQPDGKIILAGRAANTTNGQGYNAALARYNTDGTLDTSFGTNGKVDTDFGGTQGDIFRGVALQSNGKIIACGYSDNGIIYQYILACYNSDGSLDTTFGTNGKVVGSFGVNGGQSLSIIIQTDNKIIISGITDNGSYNYFALTRFNSNGSLDTTFGTNGNAINDFSYDGICYSLALQADGKIVASGTISNGTNTDFGLVRYNSNGSLDTTFGSNGKVITDFANNNEEDLSVAIQLDGKIVVGGLTVVTGQSNNFALARYNSDGSLDITFGSGGLVNTDFAGNVDAGYSLALQSDSKIILGGFARVGSYRKFALVRYTSTGSLDTTFGIGGLVNTDFGAAATGRSVILQSDGKIILGGYANVSGQGSNFALARYINDPGVTPLVIPTIPTISICFPSGTPVVTDQGSLAIEKIDSKINTIRGKKIVAITKTVTIEDNIVCIEKDALGENIPSQKTYISRNHKLLYNKQMVKAKNLIGEVEGVYNKKYNDEILYNVLLETHEKMMVNNLIVETLDPSSIVAQLYNNSLTETERYNTIVFINQCANAYKKKYGKLR